LYCFARVNSFKRGRLKHWKNACRRKTPPAAERQRHFSLGMAGAYDIIASNEIVKFQALKLRSIRKRPDQASRLLSLPLDSAFRFQHIACPSIGGRGKASVPL